MVEEVSENNVLLVTISNYSMSDLSLTHLALGFPAVHFPTVCYLHFDLTNQIYIYIYGSVSHTSHYSQDTCIFGEQTRANSAFKCAQTL